MNSKKTSDLNNNLHLTSENRLLTLAETSQLLNLKVSRLRYEIFKKHIPFLKIGRTIRFAEKDLILWIESKRQAACLGAQNER